MATTLLVKTLIGLCDGPCRGEVTLTTDGVREAYAVIQPERGSRYVEQDCDAVSRDVETGTITVQCAAVNPDNDEHCHGSIAFDRAALDEAAFEGDNAARFMHDMDVE